MTTKTRSFRPSPALVIACVALFAALSGSAIAAGLAKNSVRSPQIVDGTVRTIDLRDNAVNSAKVADQTLTANDLGPDSVNTEEIAENAVGSSEVAPDSLAAGDLAANLGRQLRGRRQLADRERPRAGFGRLQRARRRLGRLQRDRYRLGPLQRAGPDCPAHQRTPGNRGRRQRQRQHRLRRRRARMISGGGQPANFGVEMTSSRPQGNGWLYQARNNNGAASSLTVFAYCLSGGSSN